MIVDVLRNDLGRVCRPGSVRVPRLCRLERTAAVQHLVSTVTGELADGHDAFDLLAASFPGGSITGAPKIRAMEILEELEPVRRGPYTGALGWIGPDGAMQTSILIRTFVADGRRLTLHVGGGITYRSDPAAEWDETVAKARGPFSAIGGVNWQGARDRPARRLGGRSAAASGGTAPFGVRPRLPARRRHLRDASSARRAPDGAQRARRPARSLGARSGDRPARRHRGDPGGRDPGTADGRGPRRPRWRCLGPDHGESGRLRRPRRPAAGRVAAAARHGRHPGMARHGRASRSPVGWASSRDVPGST